MTATLGLSTYQWNNNIKSMLLLAAFPCLLIGLVALFFCLTAWGTLTPDGAMNPTLLNAMGLYAFPAPQTITDFTFEATKIAVPYILGIAALWLVIGTLFNEGLIRRATGAAGVSRKAEPELYNLLENLCISRGMKMPHLYIIETPMLNAYASGLNESSYAVTVTRGILDKLDKYELQAVLAHELSHIINRDVRLLIVTILFTGMLAFFAEMAFRSIRFSGGGGKKGRGTILIIIIAAVVLLIGYGASMLFRFALSRKREYLADAGAVELTKRPEALIGALKKISGHSDLPAPSGVQAMLIDHKASLLGLFSTHPPIENRIDVLKKLGALPEDGNSIIPKVG